MSDRKYQLEDLRKWFGKGSKGDWVRVGTDGDIKGDCAREPGEGKPKCMPRDKAHSMSKKDRGASARRKRRADPDVDRPGTGNKPIMVKTDKEDKKKKTNEAALKVSMSNFKGMAKNIATGVIEKDSNKKVMGYLRAMGKKIRLERDPNSRSGFAVVIEKNVPTNPKLWSKFKSQAKAKFDVYPSAYANGWAAKQYKAAGGGWKTEDVDEALAAPAKPVTDKEIKRRQNISKTKNAPKTSFKSMRNRLGEAIDYMKVSKELDAYAKKHGGMDKREFEKAAAYVREIGRNSALSVQDKAGKGLNMLFKNADTDVRDRMQMILTKGGFKVKGGYVMRESVELDEATTVSRADFDKLKKGDKITIEYGSSIRSSTTRTFMVKSKTRSAKYNVDKVNMVDPQKPGGMKFHLYSRDGKDATLALGDMGATIKSYSIGESLGESDYTPATKSTDVGGKPLLRKQVKKAIDKKNIAKQNAMTRKYNKMHKESVELDENYRTLAVHGMGTEKKGEARVGLELDYYDGSGTKRMGKIIKVTPKGYIVRDDKDGRNRQFNFHDRVKAKELLAKHGKGKYNESLEEKAVSKSQQKFMGMVRAVQKGEMDDASPEVKKAADSMSKKDVKDFAGTKHKGLPDKKEETADEACWQGYTQKGMKKKGDRMVPNCVPESFKEFSERQQIGKSLESDKF